MLYPWSSCSSSSINSFYFQRSMDLTSPLFLGGIPSPTPYLRGLGFNGCIRNVRINEVPLDMGLPIYNRNTRIGCNRKRDFCKSDSCSQHGTCVNSWDRMICVCDEGYAGERCEKGLCFCRCGYFAVFVFTQCF